LSGRSTCWEISSKMPGMEHLLSSEWKEMKKGVTQIQRIRKQALIYSSTAVEPLGATCGFGTLQSWLHKSRKRMTTHI
jgi:hypothetical protein